MTHVLIHVDAAKRMLIVKPNARNSFTPMPSRVSWVFVFFGMLIEASRRDLALDEATLQRALAALGQLSFGPRAMTTWSGSWHRIILRCR